MSKTPAIFDFDAIREARMPRSDESGAPRPSARLAALIAEEKRMREALHAAIKKADDAYFAWHGDRPSKIGERAPADIEALWHHADEEFGKPTDLLMERICRWIPATAGEAVALLARGADDDLTEEDAAAINANVLTGLRAMAACSGETSSLIPEARGVQLLRQWISAELRAEEIGKTAPDDDPEFEAACEKTQDAYHLICAEPTTDLPSFAAKVYLLLYDEHPGGNADLWVPKGGFYARQSEVALAREVSRILPDLLGPRSAAFIAAAEAEDDDEDGAAGPPKT